MLTWATRLCCVALLTTCVVSSCKIKVRGDSPDGEGFPCAVSEDCPLPQAACMGAQCVGNQCVHVPAPAGAALPERNQTAGDCKQLVCDGDGNATPVTQSFDVPPDDKNDCTDEICDGHNPRNLARSAGYRCGKDGVCNGNKLCGVCVPREKKCAPSHRLTTCNGSGQWDEGVVCPSNKPVCSKANCYGISQVALGAAHVCARFEDGRIRCWGSNDQGQLGSGNGRPPPWGSGVGAIAFGRWHACGLRAGQAWCWGANDFGQLGIDSFVSSNGPAPVANLTGVTQVAVGENHSCALASGKVWCWGRNDSGQLGSGKRPAKPLEQPRLLTRRSGRAQPQAIDNINDASRIALGPSHSCARSAGAGHSCWGARTFALPAPIEPPSKATADDPDAAPPDPAQVKQFALRQAATAKVATPVAGLNNVSQLACGKDFCCARLSDGSARCWGNNKHGQLGDGTTTTRFRPTAVVGLKGIRQLVAGWTFACAHLSDDKVACWGDNRRHQSGTGGSEKQLTKPKHISSLGGVRELHAGEYFACAFGSDGQLRCWGDGQQGQLSDPKAKSARHPIVIRW